MAYIIPLTFFDVDPPGSQPIRQKPLPVWRTSLPATKEIQTNRLVLREGMNSQVRFPQKQKPRQASGVRELVPDGFPYRLQLQAGNQGQKEIL